MLYLIAEYLGFPGLLNLVRYLSFRTGGAVAPAASERCTMTVSDQRP